MIYLATDHRGFELKEELKQFLGEHGEGIEDMGALVYEAEDDYVDFASLAAEKIAQNPAEHRGIFLCGSGHGMDIVANKYKGIHATLCADEKAARQSREHGNANVLVLAADSLDGEGAKKIVSVWLETAFSKEERHVRRLQKIEEIEKKNFQ